MSNNRGDEDPKCGEQNHSEVRVQVNRAKTCTSTRPVIGKKRRVIMDGQGCMVIEDVNQY